MIDTGCPCSMCRKNRAIRSAWRGGCANEPQISEDNYRRWIDTMTPEELERVRKALDKLGWEFP